ncbi:MAG: UDP-2,3-diacylglucosamine hydrolase [Gammaproteobacteria bacterium]|jgi:UDP-2,3-diacylglucosamine hydrolase|nr:UDP-2,3-diacylglucosamine hydrolase [Gammaproteobacteria bacterium]
MNSSRSLLISDLHLSENHSDTTRLFFKFIEEKARQAEALYILGDFFEFWIGDDDLSEYHLHIIKALATLSQSGVKLFVMHGNRDFLLGKKFAKLTGAVLLKDPCVMNFYGKNVLLTHGDQLCTDDIRYQRYRKVVNIKWVQKLFLLLPLSKRRGLALRIHHSNPHRKPGQYRAEIADVTTHAVEQAFAKYQVNDLIHGHTHRLGIHDYPENRKRYVMGDWHEHGSYIEISQQGIELHIFT